MYTEVQQFKLYNWMSLAAVYTCKTTTTIKVQNIFITPKNIPHAPWFTNYHFITLSLSLSPFSHIYYICTLYFYDSLKYLLHCRHEALTSK